MNPDFNKKTIDTLAKRAAYKCSNPDCRVSTVGPNSDEGKSTIIGEAAHIYGARPDSKRYNLKMTDNARAEITNAIWLCRNCHKLIDTDEEKYTSDILFSWREQHEEFTLADLGSATDRIQYENLSSQAQLFNEFPPLIRRIVIDKPDGWEWRLTAELMRYMNNPFFRKLEDLRNGLYLNYQHHLESEDVLKWIQKRLTEASNLTQPFVVLIERLNKCWGEPGEAGDIDEIFHITSLIRDHLEQIVLYEEQVYFANVPDEYNGLISLLKNIIGSQAEKLATIPDSLDELLSLIGTNHGGTTENPLIIKKNITFDVPDDFEKEWNRELKHVKQKIVDIPGVRGLKIFIVICFVLLIGLICN